MFEALLVLAIVTGSAAADGVEDLVPSSSYRVNTYADEVDTDGCTPSHCSLREAIDAANQGFGTDTVLLSAGVYTSTRDGTGENQNLTGDFDILTGMKIEGEGAGVTFVDGGGIERLFDVPSDGANRNVILRRLTLTGGFDSGTAVVEARGSSTRLTVEDCEVSGNVEQGETNGMVSAGTGAELTIRRSTIAENTGIGVSAKGSAATLENVTISGNTGVELVAGSGVDLVCHHCTISDPADSNSAEVLAFGSGTQLDFMSSVVEGECDEELLFNVGSFGGNLEGPGDTCHFNDPSDENDVADLGLGPLQDNGGPTRTKRPIGGSLVVNAGLDGECLATDQPGGARPAVGCDAGAVETEAPIQPTPLFIDGFDQGSSQAWSTTVG